VHLIRLDVLQPAREPDKWLNISDYNALNEWRTIHSTHFTLQAVLVWSVSGQAAAIAEEVARAGAIA
jgi:hypothetical protein